MDRNTFHVYGHRAYRSEIALYRAEGVTAAEAEQISAPADTAWLCRVELDSEPDLITDDYEAAWRAFQENAAHALRSIEVAA